MIVLQECVKKIRQDGYRALTRCVYEVSGLYEDGRQHQEMGTERSPTQKNKVGRLLKPLNEGLSFLSCRMPIRGAF
uniref:Uncharacterized protein n=1 Tax=Physcomitrium patens TaxID=3218 RepID=A0A2K1IE53_PHYPA|nr:hypothetical protein PHYPA_029713 [Physcomitrium patens]